MESHELKKKTCKILQKGGFSDNRLKQYFTKLEAEKLFFFLHLCHMASMESKRKQYLCEKQALCKSYCERIWRSFNHIISFNGNMDHSQPVIHQNILKYHFYFAQNCDRVLAGVTDKQGRAEINEMNSSIQMFNWTLNMAIWNQKPKYFLSFIMMLSCHTLPQSINVIFRKDHFWERRPIWVIFLSCSCY